MVECKSEEQGDIPQSMSSDSGSQRVKMDRDGRDE